jgi:alpha-glucosidase (family GH31 glycosyl hydrolase)
MDGRRDFTIDPDNFGDLPALVDEVKQDGLRFIIILDPAIANDYQTYDRGVALSVYAEWVNATIKPDDQPTDSNIIIGNVLYINLEMNENERNEKYRVSTLSKI